MADARRVLEVALDEALLLATTGGHLEQEIVPIIRLAKEAFRAGEGEVPDEDIRASGIHETKLNRLGLLEP